MTDDSRGVTYAILETYVRMTQAGWPTLHPDIVERSKRWAGMSGSQLRAELDALVAEASRPGCTVGLFWKLGSKKLTYEGANAYFLGDAGCQRLEDLLGRDDLDPRFPWGTQAAKFMSDDRKVMTSGKMLTYIERQKTDTAINWNRIGKAPIQDGDGVVHGIFAMYQTLDPEEGRLAYWRQATAAEPAAL